MKKLLAMSVMAAFLMVVGVGCGDEKKVDATKKTTTTEVKKEETKTKP